MAAGASEQNPFGWGPRKIFASAVGGVLLTGFLSWLPWKILNRPLSELPAWLQTGATLLGVGAAIVAGFYAARAFLIEHRRESRWDDDQRTAQASLVAAWWGKDPRAAEESRAPSVREMTWARVHGPRDGVLLRNASEVPVNEVDIVLRRPDSQMELDWIALGVLPPSIDPVWRPVSKGAEGLFTAMPDGMAPEVLLFFTDASGNRWTRTPQGSLEPSDRIGPRTIYHPPTSEPSG